MPCEKNFRALRIIGPSYRGTWTCIGGCWDLQSPNHQFWDPMILRGGLYSAFPGDSSILFGCNESAVRLPGVWANLWRPHSENPRLCPWFRCRILDNLPRINHHMTTNHLSWKWIRRWGWFLGGGFEEDVFRFYLQNWGRWNNSSKYTMINPVVHLWILNKRIFKGSNQWISLGINW